MTHKLVEKFQKVLNGEKITVIHGPLSPVLLTVVWVNNDSSKVSILTLNKGRESYILISEKQYRAECIRGFREYCEGRISLDEIKKRYFKLEKDVNDFYDRMMLVDFKNISNVELEKHALSTNKIFEELADKTVFIEIFDKELLFEVLGQSGEVVIGEVWEHGTHPTFISFEARRLRSILDFISEGDFLNINPVRYIYTDYVWTKDKKEILVDLESIKNQVSEKEIEYQKLKTSADDKLKEFNIWKKTVSDLSLKTVEYMQTMMEQRDLRKDIVAKIQVAIVDITEELFRRAGIDPIHAPHIGLLETIKGISYLEKNKKSIESRKNGSISITYYNGDYEVDLCDYEITMKELQELSVEKGETKELKGQVANKGKVTGTVKIVIDPQDDKDFKQGDILITSMTRPEFVPLMKKAGAVVTNEGGITCHAAIISRELNIPCIIGTKHATRIFNTGDLVEVDANSGVVRIIK